ncbi:Receptor-type tyrosine-protein phosphatase-like N [Trichinella britovi]|uniref:Receptor-type tyrosine-protein phosphatase-like N n=1 Tax=Trichinella britovi TaxID=45882 RepID=A0A0V1CHN4_TRIBR|nr:Receptor-type tyrosine-protein phosphatase-like N [Trichinella britovi]
MMFFIGCLVDESICEDGQLCADDGIVGQCLSPRETLLTYVNLKPIEKELLTLQLKKFALNGYPMASPLVQCLFSYMIFVSRYQIAYNPGFCNAGNVESKMEVLQRLDEYLSNAKELMNDDEVETMGARFNNMENFPFLIPLISETLHQDPHNEVSIQKMILSKNVQTNQPDSIMDANYWGESNTDISDRVEEDRTVDRLELPFYFDNQNQKLETAIDKKDLEEIGIINQGTGNKEHKIQTRLPLSLTATLKPLSESEMDAADVSDQLNGNANWQENNRIYVKINRNFTNYDDAEKLLAYLNENVAFPNNITFTNVNVDKNEISFEVHTIDELAPSWASNMFEIPATSVDAGQVATETYQLMKKAMLFADDAEVIEAGITNGIAKIPVQYQSNNKILIPVAAVSALLVTSVLTLLAVYLYRSKKPNIRAYFGLSSSSGNKVVKDYEEQTCSDVSAFLSAVLTATILCLALQQLNIVPQCKHKIVTFFEYIIYYKIIFIFVLLMELCRRHMTGKVKVPEPLRGVMDTLAQRLGSQTSEPSPPAHTRSTNSSVSSWPEESVQSNIDISTGHMILSYLEDHLKNKERLEKEWHALESYQADQWATTTAALLENSEKNRSEILPFDHCRVVLNKTLNQANDDYINASTICDSDPRSPTYIAAQGPLADTVADFWQLIWEQGSVAIVNLTKLVENNNEKCCRYWPENGTEIYHVFEVHLVSEHIWCEDYLVRSFYLKNINTQETRTVTQFHFLSWPEDGVPMNAKSLLEFRRKVNKSYRGQQSPVVVHCNDGAGRTGTYILIDMVLNRINKGVKELDIAASLEHLRDQRMNMVRTMDQFQFVIICVAEEVQAILKAMPNE